jgi:cell division protein FtsI (penicillin-binding protein 3)
VLGAFLVAFSLIAYKLVSIQGMGNTQLAKVTNAYEYTTHTADLRGSILASNGDELALSQMRPLIFANPGEIKHAAHADHRSEPAQREYEADKLAPLLHIPARKLVREFTVHRTWFPIVSNQPLSVGRAVDKLALPGIGSQDGAVRFHPDGPLASPVLGSVNSQGGSGGLEAEYNKVLSGTPGEIVQSVDANGDPVPGSITVDKPAVNGDDIVTTINEALQYQTEQALGAGIKAAKAVGGTAIVMDTRTGDLLAVASMVSSPKGPVEAPSAQAFTNVYEPGSVAKIITISGALADGTITPSSKIAIPMSGVGAGTPGLTVGGTTFHDAEDHPAEVLSPTGVLAQSSNLGAIKIGLGLGAQRLYRFVQAYGLTQRTAVDFPGESEGLVPTLAEFSGTTLPTMAFGEANSVTAAQMVAAVNTVANRGVYMSPRLVTASVGASGKETTTKVPAPRRVIPATVAGEVTGMMQQVVSSGTGTAAKVSGYAIAGKTGTGYVVGPNGQYVQGHYVSSFVGFAPAQKPAVTVMVVMNDTAQFGATASAPAFATITRDALLDLGIASDGAQAAPSISSVPVVNGQPETNLLGL